MSTATATSSLVLYFTTYEIQDCLGLQRSCSSSSSLLLPHLSLCSIIVVGPLQKMYGSGESTSHAFPPTLLRIASAPPRTTFNKLRICLRLAKADLSNQLLNFDPASSSAQFTVNNSSKTSSVTSFHQVFAPEVTQQEICSNCLPELLHTVFSGSDASLLYFGGASRLKDELLYSSRPNNYGIFVAALAWTFKLITEFRERKPQFRYSVRISALHYSQKTDQLIDLFEQFNEKVGRPVTVVDDPALGIRVENQTEIRVDSVDKAMFYLDRLIDHRTIEDEESQRGSHVFFYILVYRYKVEGNQVAGGKSRFCLMDLGLGEKHSRNGHITLSAIGNILLAIFQGQKHLPSRQSIFCQLLKESIGNSRNKSSVLLSTLPSNEEDHILQLANKLHKATRSTIRRGKSGSDHSSVASDEKPVRRRTAIDSEQSSSEQSCAETVIFLGPSLKTKEPSPPDPPKHQRKMSDPVQIDFPRCHSAPRTPIHGPALQPIPIDFPPFYKTSSHSLPRNCTFTPPSPLRRTQHDDKFFVISNPMAHEPPAPQPSKHKSADVDPKKNQMIVNWLMHQEPANGSPRRFQGQQEYGHDVGGIGVPLEPKKPSFFGAKFARLATKMDSAIQCNEEDIDSEMLNVWNAARFLDDIVEDEEESLRTSSLMSSTANREALAEKTQDMNILSMNMDQISLQGDEDDMESVEMNDDDLEKAMAASDEQQERYGRNRFLVSSNNIFRSRIPRLPLQIHTNPPRWTSTAGRATWKRTLANAFGKWNKKKSRRSAIRSASRPFRRPNSSNFAASKRPAWLRPRETAPLLTETCSFLRIPRRTTLPPRRPPRFRLAAVR
ncbi:hypothetical protein L596_028254 [Steinernema carpocapsae]|uniref:Kinesin motor domain-containing protein n=1 Tax=Steinernema carpocapsae TaxID=34508 RepID=A0A4U5LXW7_STECR|nr:hypothetical protein L596_028254 [Steinernema carpocapsae]